MSDRIRRAGQVAWSLVGLALLVVVAGVVGWWVRVVWPPLILAGAIVFLLNPGVTLLHRRGLPRVAGTAMSYLAFFAVVGLAVLIIAPLAADQARGLDQELPAVRADVERWINDRAEQSQNWIVKFPSVGELESEVGGGESSSLANTFATLRDFGGRVVHVVLIIVLAPIIAFYLLVDLPRLRVVAESLVPARARDEVFLLAARLNRAIGGFFRGQLFVALIIGVLVSTGLALVDLPFWLLVGMVAGFSNIIPLIGPWVGAVPGVIIALTTRDAGTALWVVAIMAGAQQVDNHFISPIVMQRAVKLHPAAVMLALLTGGTLGGFFGLLIAVPTAAVLKILVSHLWHTYVLEEPIEHVAAEAEAADHDTGPGVVRKVRKDEQPESGTEPDADPEPAPAPESGTEPEADPEPQPEPEQPESEPEPEPPVATGSSPKDRPPSA